PEATSGRAPSPAAVHLVGTDGGRDEPRLIVRALLAQLFARFAIRRSIPDEHAAALKLLHETLRELGESGKRVVVGIAGLDEIRRGASAAPELSLLPQSPMRGVVFVVSARPGDAEESLQKARGLQRIELAPLAKEHMLAAARAAAPAKTEAERARAADAA